MFLAFLSALVILAACNTQNNPNKPIPCIEEAKLCPDGSYVGRVPPDCEFAECPKNENTTRCNYEIGENRKYVSKSPDECSRIRFVCEQAMEYFEDDCGCGCKKQESELQQNYCTPEQKKADVCIEIYKPVCGWSDPEKIQCIRYPCARTFSNSCYACADENVLYWTEGECPK